MLRSLPIALILILLASQCPGDVSADAPTPTQALLDRLAASRKGALGEAWIEALREVPEVFSAADKKARRKLGRAVGMALRKGWPAIQKAGFEVVVKLDDAELAYAEALRGVWPDERLKVPATWDLEVLRAVYVLRPEAAIEPLLRLLKKAKAPEIAAGALRVLGAYERSPKRVHVLEELAKIVMANAPGKSRKGSRGSDRFLAMATQLQAALNELTGQRLALKQWGPLWRDTRKKPETLFVNPLPGKPARVRR